MARSKKKRKPFSSRPAGLNSNVKLAKAYWARMLTICDIFGAKEVMSKLPKKEIHLMFLTRFRQIQFRGQQGVRFPDGLLKELNQILKDILLRRTFRLRGYDTELTYADYFTYLQSIIVWVKECPTSFDMDQESLNALFKPVLDMENGPDSPMRFLEMWLDSLAATMSSRPAEFNYFFRIEQVQRTKPEPFIGWKINLSLGRGTQKRITLDGHPRDTFQLFGWRKGLPYKPTVKAEQFCESTVMKGLEFDIFIQQHALDRLKERLDIFDERLLYLNLSESFDFGNAIPFGPNQALMAYYFYGHPLGYLLTEIVDGVAVVRTFLFLTNDGTPEGKLLKRNLGLNKLDKAYTGLDKISTFVYGHLKEDKVLHGILKKSHCQILVNISPEVLTGSEEKTIAMTAENIKTYLAPAIESNLKQAG